MPERRLVRVALLAFVASRALLFVLLIAGSQIAFRGRVYTNSVWETDIAIQRARVLPELERVAMVGDAWWYRGIALEGYTARNAAFFPLYPLLVRVLHVTGSFALDGMLLSNLALLIALPLLGLVAVRYGLDAVSAERAIWLLAFFPTSYFLSLPVTESLFLALSLGSILAAKSDRWWLAGLLGGLAAATRFPGVLLLLPLAIEVRARPRHAFWLALVPAGTGAFMLHLHRTTGDALAFVHAQQSWRRSAGLFWQPLADFVTNPAHVSAPWNFIALNFAIAIVVLAAALVLLARRQWALGVYTLASILVPLSTGTLQSISRYALVMFPLFFLLASKERPWLLAVFAAVYGWLVALVILRVDFALS